MADTPETNSNSSEVEIQKPVSLEFEPTPKRPLGLIIGVFVLLLLGIFAYTNKEYVSNLLHPKGAQEQLNSGSAAQLSGDLQGAKAAYEEGLKRASGVERDRFLLRLALLDVISGNLNVGLATLRDLSTNEQVSNEVRSRAAVLGLQAYDLGRTPETRDILFSGDVWSKFYKDKTLDTPTAQNEAISIGYMYAISIDDSIFARLYLSRFFAFKALNESGDARKKDATEALEHYIVSKELQLKPEQIANWSPSQLGNMAIQKARAMSSLQRLISADLIPKDSISERDIAAVYEQTIKELSSDTSDVSSISYGLYARYLYAYYLSNNSSGVNAEANLQLASLAETYPKLTDSQKITVRILFSTVRALGDETKYGEQPDRKVIVAMAKKSEAFKAFLIDQLTGWNNNDFK